MNNIFLTTGPTELYPEIKDFIEEGLENKIFSISHRSEEFSEIVKSCYDNLRNLMGIPDDFYIFFVSSATEAMERMIENLVEKNSFHFINGAFAKRFYDISVSLKKEPDYIFSNDGKGFEFENISIPDESELVCLTHNETSTGVALELDSIYELKKIYPEKIFALDIVTSVPYYKINFNFIDAAFFSVQKGFGIPSGLGVMLVKKDLINKTKYLKEKNINIGSYNNFLNLAKNADKFQTTVTPNMFLIYLLGKVSEILNLYGYDKIVSETKEKSKLMYDFFEKNGTFKPFVKNKDIRSDTTLVINTPMNIKDILKNNGYIVSSGYGVHRNKQIRIGNFPMQRLEDIKNFLKVIKNI